MIAAFADQRRVPGIARKVNYMTDLHDELVSIADNLLRVTQRAQEPDIQDPLRRLKEAAKEIDKSSSGSWCGYHANIYYEKFKPPPKGAHFSLEWGLMDAPSNGTLGVWNQFDSDDVQAVVCARAGNPDFEPCRTIQDQSNREFEAHVSEVISILEIEIAQNADAYLKNCRTELDKLSIEDRSSILKYLQPRGQIITRDTQAVGQGIQTPPHLSIVADVLEVEHALDLVKSLGMIAKNVAAYLRRRSQVQLREFVPGTHIFLGHGRSPIWRELKDFITERLNLSVDEFNGVPVAGRTNVERLSEMLDAAAFAVIVMTAEDEQPDGRFHARMNVVHEAGLFQGRLGFTRAIVLIEDGCEEFGNIEGLGQIRFPKGKIAAAFEDLRRVLEREKLLVLS